MTHPNAPLTPEKRRRLAVLVVEEGWMQRRAAERFGCSSVTVSRWTRRYRAGEPLTDRGSRPQRSPTPCLSGEGGLGTCLHVLGGTREDSQRSVSGRAMVPRTTPMPSPSRLSKMSAIPHSLPRTVTTNWVPSTRNGRATATIAIRAVVRARGSRPTAIPKGTKRSTLRLAPLTWSRAPRGKNPMRDMLHEPSEATPSRAPAVGVNVAATTNPNPINSEAATGRRVCRRLATCGLSTMATTTAMANTATENGTFRTKVRNW